MSDGATIGVLGIAATLAVAAIASMWRIVSFVIDFDARQTAGRETLRRELWLGLTDLETRLTRRVEQVERHSVGLRQWRQNRGEHEDGDS